METGRDCRWFLAGGAPETVDPGPPMLDDLDGPPEVFLGPGLEALVVGVGSDQQNCREQEVEAGLVVEVGRVDLDLEQVALGVDQLNRAGFAGGWLR